MLEVHAKLSGHEAIDFDKKRMRKVIREQAAAVRKEARKLVSRRAVSKAGENPGKDSGALQRSIKVKMYGAMAAVIAPQKTAEMGADFYPAFLMYGVRAGAVRRKDHQKQVDNGQGWRIERRNDFMMSALFRRSAVVQTALTEALKDALKPR